MLIDNIAEFLALSLCIILVGGQNHEVKTNASQHNVLFIVVDDLAPVISAYGGPAVTPNIDQLAANSIKFTSAYCQQPLCAPSRTSFLTGRRPDTTKTYNNRADYWRTDAGNFTTLPQYFKESGYYTASFGKIFHNGIVSGFKNDFPYSWSVLPYHAPSEKAGYEPVCPGSDGKLHFNLLCPVNVSTQPLGTLPDIQNADHIIEMFQNLSRSRQIQQSAVPFFLAIGFHKPHISFRYPMEYLSLYPLESIHEAANAFYSPTQPAVSWNPWMDLKRRDDIAQLMLPFPYGPMPQKYHLLIRQAYYASTTYMDYELGRVLQALEDAGYADNTVISFVGDHGWQLGGHQEWSKFSNYATATRVPFMIHVPGVTDNVRRNETASKFQLKNPFHPNHKSAGPQTSSLGRQLVSDSLVELVDLFPSIARLAGLPLPPLCPENSSQINVCVEGVSLAPLIENTVNGATEPTWKTAVFSQVPRPSDLPQPDSDQPTLANITIMGYSMVTHDSYHYTEWVGFNNESCAGNWADVHARELYILDVDPLENDNVADLPIYSDLVKILSHKLRKGWRDALPKQFN